MSKKSVVLGHSDWVQCAPVLERQTLDGALIAHECVYSHNKANILGLLHYVDLKKTWPCD